MLYFRQFCKKISKPWVKFSRILTKNTIVWGNFEKILKFFDEKSMEKLNLYIFLGNLLLKIETSEITSFFYNNFSGSGGGLNPLTPPCLRHCHQAILVFKWLLKIKNSLILYEPSKNCPFSLILFY